MLQKTILICCLLLFEHLSSVFAGYGVARNLSDFLRHRQKRGLIFNNGGSTKLVIGPIYPVELGDPVAWRNFLILYNIHVGNYNIPGSPLYPWDKWEDLYARSNKEPRNLQTDESREFLYLVLEKFMNQKHGSGRQCLLRAICENAQVHHHVDLFSQILNVILTPGRADVDAIYNQAFEMGRAGADCLSYYHKCPLGLSFLDQFLVHNSEQFVFNSN